MPLVHKTQRPSRTSSRATVALDLRAVGRRIREIRGFERTQEEFAAALGIRQTQLSRYEHGRSAPPLEVLLKLRADSGRSVDWILAGTG